MRISGSSVRAAITIQLFVGLTGMLLSAVPAKPAGLVSAKDFGVAGDGVANDTGALQSAINASAAASTVLHVPAGTYRITAGLTTPKGFVGIVGDGQQNTRINVNGKGYTALSVTNGCIFHHFRIVGSNQAADGMVFSGKGAGLGGPGLAWLDVKNVRVTNLDGYGVKIDNVWDSTFDGVSVEKCGNAESYAFSVNGVSGDTTNMSLFNRLQVEQANAKAIFIHGSTLSCVFTDIHSERATGDGVSTTWSLGGASCRYLGTRLSALSDATCRLSGANTVYDTFRIEGTEITTQAEASGGGRVTHIAPRVYGTWETVGSQGGALHLVSPYIGTFSGQGAAYVIDGGRIDTLRLGGLPDSPDPAKMVLLGTDIGTLDCAGARSAAMFTNCTIDAVASLPSASVMNGCTVASKMALGNRYLRAADCTFKGNLTVDGGEVECVFDNCRCEGTVSGLGPPTGGTWYAGDRTDSLDPTAGGVEGWICVTGGTPGVWKKRGSIGR